MAVVATRSRGGPPGSPAVLADFVDRTVVLEDLQRSRRRGRGGTIFSSDGVVWDGEGWADRDLLLRLSIYAAVGNALMAISAAAGFMLPDLHPDPSFFWLGGEGAARTLIGAAVALAWPSLIGAAVGVVLVTWLAIRPAPAVVHVACALSLLGGAFTSGPWLALLLLYLLQTLLWIALIVWIAKWVLGALLDALSGYG